MRSKFVSITFIAFIFATAPIFYKLSITCIYNYNQLQLKMIFSQKFLALKLKETMKIIAFKLHAHIAILVLKRWIQIKWIGLRLNFALTEKGES